MRLFTAGDYSFKELLHFDNAVLSELLSSHTTLDIQRQNELMLYSEGVNKARNHPGFTFLHHFQEYVQLAKDPYGYTQFLEHYRQKRFVLVETLPKIKNINSNNTYYWY